MQSFFEKGVTQRPQVRRILSSLMKNKYLLNYTEAL